MQIGEFQALMVTLYGEQDRERGIPATVAWLAEEVGELAQAVRKGSLDQQRHELGDVLAWLASIPPSSAASASTTRWSTGSRSSSVATTSARARRSTRCRSPKRS